MTTSEDRYWLLLRHAELCRDIAAAVPTADAAELCERTAVEFEKLAAAYSPYAVNALTG